MTTPGPSLRGSRMLGEAGGESSPTADTGHSLVQLTQSGVTSPGSAPHPAPPTVQAQPHSQRQGDGQDGTGMGAGWDRQARRRKRRGRAAVSSWSGLLRFHLTRQVGGRQRHTDSKPLTDVCLGRMQTVQHGQAQTPGDRGDTDTEHWMGTRLGRWVPREGPGLPNPCGQDRKNKIRTSCKMPICWVLSFSLS